MRFLRALIAATFALLVMGAGVQDAWLLCRSQKTVHKTCCCKHVVEAPGAVDELQRAPCCDAVEAAIAAIPPSTSGLAAFATPPPVLLEVMAPASVVMALVPNAVVAAPVDETPRVPTGPPIPIRLHQLLI